MDLEILQFYINALIQHRKAGKPDGDFLKKLSTILLNDQIPSNVYGMMNTIIKKDMKPTDAEEKPSKHKINTKPTTEPKKANTATEMDHEKIKAFLKNKSTYVEYSNGCSSSYRKASIDDILNGKQLYKETASPSSDPCRGTSYIYIQIPTPDFTIQKNVSTNTGSCGVGLKNGRC